MSPMSVVCGALVGLSLGLTGGGGAIFAAPLLVYALGVPPREALAISLAAVGVTACIGSIHRGLLGQVEWRTGLLFAAAGMLGAPLGTWIARRIPESALLLMFSGMMLLVAIRMWRTAPAAAESPTLAAPRRPGDAHDRPAGPVREGPTCQRDAAGALFLSSGCARLLLIVGVLTGVLSGLFGVGGGFVIVPALVMFTGISMQRAIGTSLLAISLVSLSGVASQVWSGQAISPVIAGPFLTGGVAGLFLGQRLGRRLPGPVLQRVFAAAIVGVAAFVVVRNLGA